MFPRRTKDLLCSVLVVIFKIIFTGFIFGGVLAAVSMIPLTLAILTVPATTLLMFAVLVIMWPSLFKGLYES